MQVTRSAIMKFQAGGISSFQKPHFSSGGFRCRNWMSNSRSYTILRAPQMSNGQARRDAANKAPANAGLAAAARLRGTDVKLAAAARSISVTTAMTYEERVGTSICE